jgi:hypothetical protein
MMIQHWLIALPRDPKIDAMPEKYRRPHTHERVQTVERMLRQQEAEADATAIVQQFNERLAAKKTVWFWPTIAAALTSKHYWLVIVCDACGGVTDLDLTFKRRDPNAPVRVALDDVRCPRCNGHGRPRIIGLARIPSI